MLNDEELDLLELLELLSLSEHVLTHPPMPRKRTSATITASILLPIVVLLVLWLIVVSKTAIAAIVIGNRLLSQGSTHKPDRP